MELSKIAWLPLAFCEPSLSVWRFSAGKTNTIEDLTSKVSKVTSFTVNFEGSFGRPPDPR